MKNIKYNLVWLFMFLDPEYLPLIYNSFYFIH